MRAPRLFVAVVPPAAVLDRLERLPRPPAPGVRWTRRDQWHVTLRFLGACDAAAVVQALAGLSASVGAGGLRATLGPRVALLGRAVICLPVAGLDDLAAEVVRRTASLGEPPDPRPFAGHLTLARLARRGACGLAGELFEAAFTVGEVVLVDSVAGQGRSRYEPRATVALTP